MDFFLQKKYKRKGYNGKASISIYLNIFLSQNYTSFCTLLLIVYCIAVDSRGCLERFMGSVALFRSENNW